MAISDQQYVSLNRVYDPETGTYVAMTQPGGSTGGGGDASAANQVTGNASLASIDGKLPALSGGAVPVTLASVPSHAVTNAGAFAVQVTSAPTTAVTGTFFQATQPVSIAATVATKEQRAATATVTSVNDSASNVTLLAANANRLGASIFNDSTSNLFVKLGATASQTDFTVKIAGGGYYELPYHYTGRMDGIWSADSTGAARVTEFA